MKHETLKQAENRLRRSYRVPKGMGDRPATEFDACLPRLKTYPLPSNFYHVWRDYDVKVLTRPTRGGGLPKRRLVKGDGDE